LARMHQNCINVTGLAQPDGLTGTNHDQLYINASIGLDFRQEYSGQT